MSSISFDLDRSVFRFCKIPKGSMDYSRSESLDCPLRLSLSSNYWMLETPVTRIQWVDVMKLSLNTYRFEASKKGLLDDHPVVEVDWYMALSFCQKLNLIAKAFLPNGSIFSLPSSLQWEYAARAGNPFHYCSGDEVSDLKRNGWFLGNSENKLNAVKKKESNGFGLYDMVGNVNEWCIDSAGDEPTCDSSDFVGLDFNPCRVIHGGNFKSKYQEDFEEFPSCSVRRKSYKSVNYHSDSLGFRVAIVKH